MLLKSTSYFVLADLLAKIFPLLLLPYLANKLGVDGFGELTLFHAISGFCLVFFNIGYDSALSRYFVRYGRRSYSRSFYVALIFATVAFLIGVCCFLLVGLRFLFFLAILYAYFYAIFLLFLNSFVLFKKPFLYFASTVSSSILATAFTIGVFELYGGELEYRAISLIVSIVVIMPLIGIKFSFGRKLTYALGVHAKYLLFYCAPLLPHNIATYLRGYADRWVIDANFTSDILGVYGLALQLASIGLLFLHAVYKAILPTFYTFLKHYYLESPLVKWFAVAGIAGGLLSGVVYLFIRSLPVELFTYIFGDEFRDLPLYLAVLAIGIVWQVLYMASGGILMYLGDTKFVSYISILSATIYVLLLLLFVEKGVYYLAWVNVFIVVFISGLYVLRVAYLRRQA